MNLPLVFMAFPLYCEQLAIDAISHDSMICESDFNQRTVNSRHFFATANCIADASSIAARVLDLEPLCVDGSHR